ncbi:MAG: ATP-grasp domain-containing protein [Anaerolineae bacterium]|nr:ATP-grasp domain-containing protein [Anaerolineae bacterium]MDW8171936.1 ATP-grasp domain-containing protein [Anaerolineae bacterium]
MIRLLFCQDPQHDDAPDSAWIHEVEAAQAAGWPVSLISYEALAEQDNPPRAVRALPVHHAAAESWAIYRGWPLSQRHYARLYDALLSRGVRLLTAPSAYDYSRCLSEALPDLGHLTPRSVVFQTDGRQVNYETLMALLLPFNGGPVIVRDDERAFKRDWYEACYIPSSSNREAVEAVTQRFIALRGGSVTGGLIYREYVDFRHLNAATPGRPPLALEYRLAYADGQLIATLCYWDAPDAPPDLPDAEQFRAFAAAAPSPFFMMDVAQRQDGTWQVIDLEDGQVSMLPRAADARAFYVALRERLSS